MTKPSSRPGRGLDLGLGAVEVERADAVDDGAHPLGLLAHPEHGVLLADQPGQALAGLDHAAVDGEIGPQRLDRLDPGRASCARSRRPRRRSGCRRPRRSGARSSRVVELGPLQLLERVDLPGPHLGHGQLEALVHDGAEAGLDHHLVRRLLERLERPDPGVHVRHGDDPVEIVVVVGIGVVGQAQLRAPAADEAAPEEIADRHAVGLLVAQGLVHALELAERVFARVAAGRDRFVARPAVRVRPSGRSPPARPGAKRGQHIVARRRVSRPIRETPGMILA